MQKEIPIQMFFIDLNGRLNIISEYFDFKSTPSFASSGFTNSRISACGTGVAAIVKVSAADAAPEASKLLR
jgi:hypothetical protein